jgi:hypothetical protein
VPGGGADLWTPGLCTNGLGVPSMFVRGTDGFGTPRFPSDCGRGLRFIENWEGRGVDSDWRLSILEITVRARAVRLSRCGVVGRTGEMTREFSKTKLLKRVGMQVVCTSCDWDLGVIFESAGGNVEGAGGAIGE